MLWPDGRVDNYKDLTTVLATAPEGIFPWANVDAWIADWKSTKATQEALVMDVGCIDDWAEDENGVEKLFFEQGMGAIKLAASAAAATVALTLF